MKKLAIGLAVTLSLLAIGSPAQASINKPCSKIGSISGTQKKPLVCKRVKGKRIWVRQVVARTTTTTVYVTNSRAQAVKSATSYLRFMAFSRSGLIKQLEYEKYSLEDATYGVDAQNADWNAQASKVAASYLKTMSFSRSGLISQLVYEGFTQSQAEYGVSTTGL